MNSLHTDEEPRLRCMRIRCLNVFGWFELYLFGLARHAVIGPRHGRKSRSARHAGGQMMRPLFRERWCWSTVLRQQVYWLPSYCERGGGNLTEKKGKLAESPVMRLSRKGTEEAPSQMPDGVRLEEYKTQYSTGLQDCERVQTFDH
jgi:hypothetical protein